MSKVVSIVTSIFIIFLPLLYNLSGDILTNEVASCVFVLLLLFVAIIYIIHNLLKRRLITISINKVDILLVVFWLYALYGMLLNNEWETDRFVIYKWSAVILCYLFFRNYTYSKISLLIACCISGIVQSLIAICQKAGLLFSRNLVFDVTGSFNNPGPLGGYIAACSVITIGLLYYNIRNKRDLVISWLLSAGLFIQLYGLYLTGSRAAILSFISGCLFLLFFSIPMNKIAGKYKKQLVMITSLILIICGSVMYQYRPASADGRLLIWRVSANMIADAPFLGHGIHGFSKEYMIYQAAYFKENPTSSFTPVADNVVYPFNEFIYIWIQYGIAGLLLFILLLGFVFTGSIGSLENNIMKAALLALLIFAFFSYPFTVFPLLLFYPFLCASVNNKIIHSFRMTNLKQTILVLIFAVSIIQTSGDVLFLKNISNSLGALYNEDSSDINNIEYEKIKGNLNFNDYYATWLIRQPETRNERIKDLYPSCETYCLSGNYYLKQKEYQSAEYYFQQASFMIPTRMRPKYCLWELYKDTGQSEKALEMANTILTMRLKIESTYTLRMKRRIRDYYK